MSCYICDRHHINYLVNAAMSKGICYHQLFSFWSEKKNELIIVTEKNATAIGQMLWDENIKSVAHRYNYNSDDFYNDGSRKRPLPGPIDEDYVFRYKLIHGLTYIPVEVLKAIDCYNYQSCEHNTYRKSDAYHFMDSLRSLAIDNLPGYDEANWGAPSYEMDNI